MLDQYRMWRAKHTLFVEIRDGNVPAVTLIFQPEANISWSNHKICPVAELGSLIATLFVDVADRHQAMNCLGSSNLLTPVFGLYPDAGLGKKSVEQFQFSGHLR